MFEFKTSPVRVPVYVSAAIVLAVFTVSYADLQRREEKNFLHNLGMPVLLVSAIATIPAIVAESAIRFTHSLIR